MKLEADPGRAPLGAAHTGHDRLMVLRSGSRTLIAIADRTSGVSSVGRVDAADRTVEELARCFDTGVIPDDSHDWEMILQGIDQTLLQEPRCDEASALVMLVRRGLILGASVGGSSASMLGPGGPPVPLSASSANDPGLGSGFAVPIGFGPVPLGGRLVTQRARRPSDARSPVPSPLFRAWAEGHLHA